MVSSLFIGQRQHSLLLSPSRTLSKIPLLSRIRGRPVVEVIEVVVPVAPGRRKANEVVRVDRQVVEVTAMAMRGEPKIPSERVEEITVKKKTRIRGKTTSAMTVKNSSSHYRDPRLQLTSTKLSNRVMFRKQLIISLLRNISTLQTPIVLIRNIKGSETNTMDITMSTNKNTHGKAATTMIITDSNTSISICLNNRIRTTTYPTHSKRPTTRLDPSNRRCNSTIQGKTCKAIDKFLSINGLMRKGTRTMIMRTKKRKKG